MTAQLEGVKPGDMIKVRENYGSSYSLHIVERVTSTRAVCEKATFMIESGAQVGTRTTGRWSYAKYGAIVPGSMRALEQKNLETKKRIIVAQGAISRFTVNAENLLEVERLLEKAMP